MRINEYKSLMERILIRKEEYLQEIENLEVEKKLKIKRNAAKLKRKEYRMESMTK